MYKAIGKVIRVLDDYHIIVDAGKDVLSQGDTVEIYETKGDVVDLDGNSLGELIIVKDKLSVIQVEEKYSICEKKETVKLKRIPISEIALSPLLRESTTTKRIPLNISDNVPIDDQPFDLAINLGDPVRKA